MLSVKKTTRREGGSSAGIWFIKEYPFTVERVFTDAEPTPGSKLLAVGSGLGKKRIQNLWHITANFIPRDQFYMPEMNCARKWLQASVLSGNVYSTRSQAIDALQMALLSDPPTWI